MNNYYFNLPQLTALTIDQRAALKEPKALALVGGAGTGKSLVSMYRHLTLCENHKNSQLLTYTRTLAYYFKNCMTSNFTASNNVDTTLHWNNKHPHNGIIRDEIIVDEAQDVSVEVYKHLIKCCHALSYGADNAQQLYPLQGTNTNTLNSVMCGNSIHSLSKNFRNAREILRLAQIIFPSANITSQEISNCQRTNGFLPDLYVTLGYTKYDKENSKRDNKIIELVGDFISELNHNIGILCPWQSNVIYYKDLLQAQFPGLSYYSSDADRSIEEGMKQLHITTFKSAKGLEFDTVIIPDFHRAFEQKDPKFHIDWKDFYVGCTRARTNLILISCDAHANLSQYVNRIEI